MRELKFRALFQSLAQPTHKIWLESTVNHKLKDMYGFVQKSEWMQYTGLKDKNGKEVYEGDILLVDADWDTYGWMAGAERQVYYKDGAFRFKPKIDTNGRGHILEDDKEFEIIGNIYENPELINP